MKLTPKQELGVWVVGLSGAVAAFLLPDTFYVMAAIGYGLALLVITAVLFWFRFRRQPVKRPRWLRITANTILILLSGIVLFYGLSVASWYK